MTCANWALTSNAMGKKETNFKQTDIGLIPHDWEVATIGDGFKFITNNTLSRGQLTNKGSVLNVHYGDVHVRFSEVLDLEKSTLPFINTGIRRNAKPYLIDGDIVMADTAEDETVGKSCEIQNIGEWKVEAGLHTFAMRPTQRYASRFLGYFINSKSFHSQLLPLIQGTKVYSVTKGDLKGTAVLKPPIEEQKRIAEVLSHFDEHIDNLAALLEKRKQVKAATMHALLSGTIRLPGFTAPWQKKSLSELFSFVRGNGLSKSAVGDKGEYPCILYGQLFTTYKENIQSVVSYTDIEEGVLSKKGDVLMPASTTTSGEDLATASALQYDGVRLGGDIIVLRPKQVIDSLFMAYIIRLLKDEITALAQGITIVHISGKRMLNLEVMIPTSVEEQSAIVAILSNMDRGIEALEQEIKKYRQMKEGAMEELLTGKVRLI